MIITIDKARNLKGFLHTGTIGPAHDPYGYEEVTIKLPHGKEAVLYFDGLGTTRFQLSEGFATVRYEEFIDNGWGPKEQLRRQMWELKMNLLAKRHTGVTFDHVRELINELPEDPMGPASRYI